MDYANYRQLDLFKAPFNFKKNYILKFTDTCFPATSEIDQEMILWEQLKGGFGNILPVNRYSAVSSTRIEQVARYGDSVALDIFVEQMRLDSDPVILKSIADNLATMELRNKVAQNRGGGTLVCGSPNEVGPDLTLDDYFDVRALVFVFHQFLRNSAV